MSARRNRLNRRVLRWGTAGLHLRAALVGICLAFFTIATGSRADNGMPIENLGADSFPATVNAVHFPKAGSLSNDNCTKETWNSFDQKTSLGAGNWQISFGPKVYATYVNTGADSDDALIDLRGLQCANSVEGVVDCEFAIARSHSNATQCAIYKTGDSGPLFAIGCPCDLDLR